MTANVIVEPRPYRLLGPVLSFHVVGDPIGQGRISFMGKGRAVHSNAKTLKPWRAKVAAAARVEMFRWRGDEFPLTGPVGLHAHFTVAKPKSAPKRRRTWPATRPDLSHYLRAVEDALDEAGVYGDDAQIVEIATTKSYPGEHDQALDVPGVVLRVYRVADETTTLTDHAEEATR